MWLSKPSQSIPGPALLMRETANVFIVCKCLRLRTSSPFFLRRRRRVPSVPNPPGRTTFMCFVAGIYFIRKTGQKCTRVGFHEKRRRYDTLPWHHIWAFVTSLMFSLSEKFRRASSSSQTSHSSDLSENSSAAADTFCSEDSVT